MNQTDKSYPPLLDARVKGLPGLMSPLCADKIAQANWNLLREDLNFPVCLLKNSALRHNSLWMRKLLQQNNALFAPHGKTTMSPELFQMQLEDGAWGITLATMHQVQVARSFGIQRILFANALVGKQAISYILSELEKDPTFDFYCLADHVQQVRRLAAAVQESGLRRPLQLLLEVGYPGGRCGCRSHAQALEVAREISQSPGVILRGVEGFEGLIQATDTETQEMRVARFLDSMLHTITACDALGYFGQAPILLTAGGSSFFDMVLTHFGANPLSQDYRIVTRSGCYLSHDSILYRKAFEKMQQRNAELVGAGTGLKPAMEVWGYVISRPEATKAIVNVGKRDLSHDDLPVAQHWWRFDTPVADTPQPLSEHVVTRLDDQHCHLQIPEHSPLQIGDAVQFGISHPCLTFDKWRVILLADDDYNITGSVSTWF